MLAERADAADRAAEPVFLAAGAKPEEVRAMSQRDELDRWLSAPIGREAADEAALMAFLGAA